MVPLSGLLCTKCNRAFNSGDLYTHMRDCSCGFDQILFTPNAEDLHTLLVSKLRTVYVDYAASLLSYGVQLRECYSFNVTCHGTCVIGIQYWYYLALILYKIFITGTFSGDGVSAVSLLEFPWANEHLMDRRVPTHPGYRVRHRSRISKAFISLWRRIKLACA